MRTLLAFAFSVASLAQAADLPVVAKVDLERYAGRWYEIARLPHRFQEQCAGDVTAEYARRDDGRIAVVNRCRRADGSFDEAQAVARVVDPATNAKLEVSFLPAWLNWLPFWADYWVIALAPDYGYAVVGHPTREYLWVLSRTPQRSPETYAALLAQIEKLGYDPQRLRRTPQGTFALLTATGKGGLRAGAAATFGVIAGDQVLMWLAAAGVAAVLKANPALFQALQYAGAAYLCWVGLRLAFARGAAAGPIPMQPGRYFRQALLITLLNPKAIVFYMAFFPLFIDPTTHRGLTTFAAMALVIAAITAVYCLLLCAFADAVAARVRAHRRLADGLRRAAGVVLVAFGLRLGMQS